MNTNLSTHPLKGVGKLSVLKSNKIASRSENMTRVIVLNHLWQYFEVNQPMTMALILYRHLNYIDQESLSYDEYIKIKVFYSPAGEVTRISEVSN